MDDNTRQFFAKELGEDFRVVSEVSLLYSGWECDPKGWVLQAAKDGEILQKKRQRSNTWANSEPEYELVVSWKAGDYLYASTSHGSPYIGTPSELEEQIKDNQSTLEEQKAALLRLAKRPATYPE